MDQRKPLLHPQVRYTVVKDEGIVIAQDDGDVHIVNDVAAFLLPLLNGKHDMAALKRKVLEAYRVDEQEAASDMESFLAELEKRNLLTYEP